MLVASLLLLFITWLVLGTHLYSPFCRGDTLIYMDLCEPKSFEFLKIWRYVDIYEDTWQVETPTIPSFIEVSLLCVLPAAGSLGYFLD